ncbi:MAG: ring-cleaving dioxygenase [Candidatus Kapabacteria bacterium]|jgi:glyoxalase family protein|nr:ring-cleaving dioxygenase [Candidatus Kapabacteria bacterium]
METLINGLHHVTAIAGKPQTNVDFYAGILGLRFIKKTVNFDAPDVYHLYYGDENGSPGSIMTFFPFGHIQRGRRGNGQMSYTAFSVPENSLGFWMERLKTFNITPEKPQQRFNEEFIRFDDNDGLGIELVATSNDTRPAWVSGSIPQEHAIRGFYTVALQEISGDRTIDLLTNQMQHRLVAEEGNRMRFEAGLGGAGAFVDIIGNPEEKRGLQGAGTVHHVAFGTNSDDTLLAIREILAEKGFDVTPLIDRQYFHSIYFREPGGILFEVATNPPGFTTDESKEALGTALKLPEWYEAKRDLIEQHLEPLEIRLL